MACYRFQVQLGQSFKAKVGKNYMKNSTARQKTHQKTTDRKHAELTSTLTPKCPNFKTTVRLSIRYSNCIKRQLNLIEEIKSKQYGKSDGNESFKCELLKEIKSLDQDDLSISQSFFQSSVCVT